MRHFLSGIAIAITAPAMAQPQGSQEPAEFATDTLASEQEKPAPDRVSVNLGAALVSEYISRGIAFAEEPSLQASVTVNLSLPALTGGAITDANAFAGTWNNVKLGSVEPNETGPLTRFYETDIYAGAAIEIDHRWGISATYYRYESLSDSFEGYNDLELIISFDDSGYWETLELNSFSFAPALRLVQEAGRPDHADSLYIQPSLTPSFDAGPGDAPVRISVPLVLGFSDHYFDSEDGGTETFGFFRTGLAATGTPFPQNAPALQMAAGVDVWFLNEDVANGLGGREVVGRVGFNWSF